MAACFFWIMRMYAMGIMMNYAYSGCTPYIYILLTFIGNKYQASAYISWQHLPQLGERHARPILISDVEAHFGRLCSRFDWSYVHGQSFFSKRRAKQLWQCECWSIFPIKVLSRRGLANLAKVLFAWDEIHLDCCLTFIISHHYWRALFISWWILSNPYYGSVQYVHCFVSRVPLSICENPIPVGGWISQWSDIAAPPMFLFVTGCIRKIKCCTVSHSSIYDSVIKVQLLMKSQTVYSC